MTRRQAKRVNGVARPIRTRRDYEGAAQVVKRLSSQPERDSAAEERLKALLREMDRYEELNDDPDTDLDEDDTYSGPRRRWSDDESGGSN